MFNKSKTKIDGKIDLSTCCNDYSFKEFTTIDKEELSDLLKV